MSEFERVDVLIVGSGPAGASTALHLVAADESWARRIVVLDKAVHPREKLCGGGVTHLGRNVLARLGLSLDVPNFAVREARLLYRDHTYSFYGNPVFTIVRRDEFDHWLVQKVEEAGVRLRQGEGVREVTAHQEYVEVVTDRATYHAQVVVGADGSRSTVRQKLKWDDDSRVARLLEVLTPENPEQLEEFSEAVAVFDFSRMTDNLQGYYWDFPSLVNDQPYMNRGVFDSRVVRDRPKADLVAELRSAMHERQRDLDDYKLKGHPIRWFDRRGRFAMPRVLLAGDSAGADPLVGEGISFALAYGDVAAQAIVDAFGRTDFTFADYRRRILDHWVLRQLPLRVRLARTAYLLNYPWLVRLGWRVARLVLRLTRWGDRDYVPVEPPHLVYSSR
jgi:menaquinone-9 beta-reductase